MAETIYIGLKSHIDVILDLDRREPIPNGNGALRVVKGKLPPVTLNGDPAALGPKSRPIVTADGYVFTAVPLEFWTAWKAQNANSTLLADSVIIEANTKDASAKIAREHEKERGLNPRLIEGDERIRGLGVKKYDARDDGIAA